MEKLLNGKFVASSIIRDAKNEAGKLRRDGIIPKLKIVRVGERKDSIAYENAIIKRMDEANIETEVLALPEDIDQSNLIKELKKLVDSSSVHGIMLFRPLPKHIDENEIKFVISPEKDVDCINPVNVAKLVEGDETGFPPCTAMAALEVLKYYKIELEGKEAVVIGRSMVVGKPLSMLLLRGNSTVTVCHSKTKNLSKVTKRADILVAAIGQPQMIKKEYLKDGAIVIDVGINVDSSGKITGDVDTQDCLDKVQFITPVPSGVGSVTTAVLAKHVIKACKLVNRTVR